MNDFKITVEPFDWNEPMAEEALEAFNPKEYSYQTASIIGTALAKLKMLEERRTDYEIVKEFLRRCCAFCDDTECEDCPLGDQVALCTYLSGFDGDSMFKPWWLTEEIYEEIMKEG